MRMTPLTTEYRIFVTISLVVSTSFGLLCRRMEQQTRQIVEHHNTNQSMICFLAYLQTMFY